MITVRYSCKVCGLEDHQVQVPARETEDVVEWLRSVVARVIEDDHARRSPGCRSRNMSNLKIPIEPGQEFIGQQVE